MTEAELAAIEARNAARTPGEWGYSLYEENIDPILEAGGRTYLLNGDPDNSPPEEQTPEARAADDANVEFIAHAPEDITALLAEVKRLRAKEDLMDRIATDRLDESDAALEAVRRERERVAGVLRAKQRRMSDIALGRGPEYADDVTTDRSHHASVAAALGWALDVVTESTRLDAAPGPVAPSTA